MTLSPTEQARISDQIIAGGIKYQDLYEELFDHYASAIENRDQATQTFDEALAQVHLGFMNYKRPAHVWDHYSVWGFEPEYGLERLQFEYKQNLNSELTSRQWKIVKSYFRWPTIVSLFLIGILSYQMAHSLPRLWLLGTLFAAVFFPLLVLLPHLFREGWRFVKKQRKFRNSLKGTVIYQRAGSLAGLFNLYLQFDMFRVAFNSSNTALITVLLFGYLVFSASFWQLYRERYTFTLA